MTWGTWGNAREHRRYKQPISYRRKCRCGCGGWSTHLGMANGVALMDGCELSVRRWVRWGSVGRDPPSRRERDAAIERFLAEQRRRRKDP
jgi:hypothetical protein